MNHRTKAVCLLEAEESIKSTLVRTNPIRLILLTAYRFEIGHGNLRLSISSSSFPDLLAHSGQN